MSDNFVRFDDTEEVKVEAEVEAPKKKPYAIWKVGDRELKLKLRTSDIVDLEERFHKNLLFVLASDDEPVMPLVSMLAIIHAASNKYEHGIKKQDVFNLFDEYVENGGTQMTLLEEVIVPLFEVSGFFTEEQRKDMEAEQ